MIKMIGKAIFVMFVIFAIAYLISPTLQSETNNTITNTTKFIINYTTNNTSPISSSSPTSIQNSSSKQKISYNYNTSPLYYTYLGNKNYDVLIYKNISYLQNNHLIVSEVFMPQLNNYNFTDEGIFLCLNTHTNENYWIQDCISKTIAFGLNHNKLENISLLSNIWQNGQLIDSTAYAEIFPNTSLSSSGYFLLKINQTNNTLILSAKDLENGEVESFKFNNNYGKFTSTNSTNGEPSSIWLELHLVNENDLPYTHVQFIPLNFKVSNNFSNQELVAESHELVCLNNNYGNCQLMSSNGDNFTIS